MKPLRQLVGELAKYVVFLFKGTVNNVRVIQSNKLDLLRHLKRLCRIYSNPIPSLVVITLNSKL